MTLEERPDLRLGAWQDVLADVEVDAVIADPPYGARVHKGHDDAVEPGLRDASTRRTLSYASWSPDDVAEFVSSWSPRTRGWIACMTSHDLIPAWEQAFSDVGRYCFAPLPCVMHGMTVRVRGDGPSSWAVWLVVARPRSREYSSWGTLPGAYSASPDKGGGSRIGGKPLALMLDVVRDYSRPGALVCDPFAGHATTLLAAHRLGRRALGAEVDPAAHAAGLERLSGVTTTAAGATQATFPGCE